MEEQKKNNPDKKKEENVQPEENIHSLLNSYLLFGINYYNQNQELVRKEQLHGTVVAVDPFMGIEVQLKGEAKFEKEYLPPIMKQFRRAKKGTYTLANGEKVVNPDWIGIINYRVESLDKFIPPEDGKSI